MQSQDRQQKSPHHFADKLHQYLLAHRHSEAEHSPSTYRLHKHLQGAALGVCTYLFVRTPLLFSVSPLPLALLCASEGALGWISLGLAIGLWQHSAHPWLYAASAAAILLFRLFARSFFTPERPDDAYPPQELRARYSAHYRAQLRHLLGQGADPSHYGEDGTTEDVLPPLLNEPIHLRVAAATLCALIPCLGIPIQGDFAFYDLYGALFYLLVTPLAAFLFAHALRSERDKSESREHTLWGLLGIAALFLSVSYCARDLTFLGLSPVLLLTTLLSLMAIQRYGLGGGVIVSTIGALAYDLRVIPLFWALAILYALLHPLLNNFSLFPALLAALLYTLLGGGNSMFWAIVPSIAVGMLCFTTTCRLRQMTQVKAERQKEKSYRQDTTLHQLICEQNRNVALCQRLSSVASSFGSLSEVFRQLGETMAHPSAHEIRHLCDEIYDEYCPACDKREICWSSDYANTGNGIYALSRAMASGKSASAELLPESLRARCPHTSAILGDISYRVARRTFEREHGANAETFAQTYDAIACLLRDILREGGAAGHELLCSEELSESVARYLGMNDIHPRHVCVSGNRRKTVQIFGLSPAALTLPQNELRQAIGRLCGAPMSRIRYDGSDDGTLTLQALPTLRADYVHRSVAAIEKTPSRQSKRTVCGDTLRLFEGEDGVFYALLCDGMGAGRNAALTSGSCAMFLERVLRAGISVQTALRMLNHYLRSRTVSPEDECCSTVDLFTLDLYTGEARFVKSGAAPSLILRDGRLYRLASHTVPIGILQAIDVQVIPFEVRAGDHILLLSDGITDAENTEDDQPIGSVRHADDWLTEFLSGDVPRDDIALIERLIELARAHGSNDDISVISIRIRAEQQDNQTV